MSAPIDVALDPRFRLTLAYARYFRIEGMFGAPPTATHQAVAVIHPARIRFAERLLGPLPAELVAAWAALGSTGPGHAEGFSPETACEATLAPHLRFDDVPETFVAIRATDVRYTYEALLNRALVAGDSLPLEPRIVTVTFRFGGFELVDEPCDFDTWIRRRYLGADEDWDVHDVPPWFVEAFRVQLSST